MTITRAIDTLWTCAIHKNIAIASLLLDYIENKQELLNEKVNNVTLIEYAMLDADIKFAELLVNHGADVNILSEHGDTLLITAAHNGNVDIVEWLLSLDKIDINAQNTDGLSVLMMAVEHDHLPLVTL